MRKTCNYENCNKRAYYALTYGNPDRCKEHKENRKHQTMVCRCGKTRPYFKEPVDYCGTLIDKTPYQF